MAPAAAPAGGHATGVARPVWFDAARFSDGDFEPDSYIAELRRFVPADDLRTQLDAHAAELRAQLSELINRDYEGFVGLSANLVDVDAAAARMRAPIEDLRARLDDAAGAVSGAQQKLEGALHKRAEAAEARDTLELLLDTSNVLSKVEKLLEEVARTSSSGGEQTGAADYAALLERVASEVNRLQYCAARGAELPFVQGLRSRIEAVDTQLGEMLARSLEEGLGRRDAAVLTRCLHAYAAVGKAAEAESAVRRKLVAPLVARCVPEGGKDDIRDLDGVLSAVIDAVRSELAFVLDIVAKQEAMSTAFCFPAGAVLTEVTAALAERRPAAFSSGVPSHFLENYHAGLSFLDSLESLAGRPGSPAAIAFRSHEAVGAFTSRWNLSVYFTLRFKEIAEVLDSALAPAHAGSTAAVGASSHGFSLKPTAACWDAIQRCWADDVYVPGLADRFLKLSLQLLARYHTWLRAGVRAKRADVQAGDDAGAVDAQGGHWALALSSAEGLLVVHHDAAMLASRARREFAATLRARLAHAPEATTAEVAAAVAEGADEIAAQLNDLVNVAVAMVVTRCAEALKQLRGIATTYRMTNKPMPTRPSAYVPTVLKPLVDVVDGGKRAFLSEEARSRLVEGVVGEVTRRYEVLTRELVKTVCKAESSLQRLRKVQPAEGAASGPSDTEKICTQLALDVNEYGRQLAKLGVQAAELPAYAALLAATENEAAAA